MIVYTVQQAHRALILTGSKDFTLRRIGANRHPRLGEVFGLEDGAAFAGVTCNLRCRLVLGEDGLRRVLEPRPAASAEGLYRLLQAAEQGASQADDHLPRVAQRDGFATWADLYAYHRAQQERGPVIRELIGWDAASVEPVK